MTDKKLTTADFSIPAGMLEAVSKAVREKHGYALEAVASTAALAVLLYQAENPPTMAIDPKKFEAAESLCNSYGKEYISLAYLKPVPELPAIVKALLTAMPEKSMHMTGAEYNAAMLKAVEVGKSLGKECA